MYRPKLVVSRQIDRYASGQVSCEKHRSKDSLRPSQHLNRGGSTIATPLYPFSLFLTLQRNIGVVLVKLKIYAVLSCVSLYLSFSLTLLSHSFPFSISLCPHHIADSLSLVLLISVSFSFSCSLYFLPLLYLRNNKDTTLV